MPAIASGTKLSDSGLAVYRDVPKVIKTSLEQLDGKDPVVSLICLKNKVSPTFSPKVFKLGISWHELLNEKTEA